jgi:hypothetical protein
VKPYLAGIDDVAAAKAHKADRVGPDAWVHAFWTRVKSVWWPRTGGAGESASLVAEPSPATKKDWRPTTGKDCHCGSRSPCQWGCDPPRSSSGLRGLPRSAPSSAAAAAAN